MRIIKQSYYFNYYNQFYTLIATHYYMYRFLMLFCSQMMDEDECCIA